MSKKIALMIVTLIACTSCATQQFQMNGKRPTIPTHEGTSHFVFWGIGQTKELDPKEICGDTPVTAVQTSYSFLNGLLSGLTYGIYSPRDYAVYCDKTERRR